LKKVKKEEKKDEKKTAKEPEKKESKRRNTGKEKEEKAKPTKPVGELLTDVGTAKVVKGLVCHGRGAKRVRL